MKHLSFSSIARTSLKFIHIQLFLSLASLPLCIAWGLPISLLSFIGNGIFGFFLTAFLFVSSLLFFSELLGIPNSLLVQLLNIIATLWLSIIQYGNNYFFVTFAKPPTIALIIVTCITFGCIACRYTHKPIRNLLILLLLFFLLIGWNSYSRKKTTFIHTIECRGKAITLVNNHGINYVIDPGAFNAYASCESTALYTVAPAIITQTGSFHVDTYIALTPGLRTLQALKALISIVQIKNIYLPKLINPSPRLQETLETLQKYATQHDCTLHEMETKTVIQQPNVYLTITPHLYSTHSYPTWHIAGTIDNNSIHINTKQNKCVRS